MDNVPIIRTVSGLRHFLHCFPSNLNESASPSSTVIGQIGLVPTMGALHTGHLSLIQRARQENQCVIVSIFVNPLQFAAHEDLTEYPQTLDQDQALCQEQGVNAIFAPSIDTILADDPLTQVIPPASLTENLCGPHRPDHFTGVATIVLKLLNIVQPTRAYFGQKDAQQLTIIQRLVQDLNLDVTVVPCRLIREATGLALSSRNQYLNPQEAQQATILHHSLQAAQHTFQGGSCDRNSVLTTVAQTLAKEPQVEVDYIDLVDPLTLQPLEHITTQGLVAVAARVGSVRLIDNILLDARRPILAMDGPAGAGKSTVTRRCAQALGLQYLDTGAMYRAIAWLALDKQVEVSNTFAIAELVEDCNIELKPHPDPQQPPQVWVNQQEVTQAIRTPEVTSQVSAVAAQPPVREALVKQQQRLGRQGGLIAEGRDIGTHVFPEAGLKIFLTASIEERARRRQQDLKDQNLPSPTQSELEDLIASRDQQDSQREFAPLRKAYDAIEINTDGMTIEQVITQITTLYQERFPAQA
ncbi:bifunctional pantoate--beta-alanine ligase/(d)CMP kinase [Acaryochloris sp. 'Moss Beach']|uniref:bifunctional pantoate--beta-alanine ligase/(d)CMP kinase n=1 Tax=Acaryochloris sp. 'Moss Beach' TaxID=2740837 RepID=UPI001F422ADE|nr:bifunctional pantoate--beta-alanine ligase/(d)CMP kinase [Acaryochloris sp. 'Moss Beach']UJB71324.1 bifunctional pantoate--beta-alanine ligase/(d)CMP kinase [Acaryochloris sp. 'Moss Beach']